MRTIVVSQAEIRDFDLYDEDNLKKFNRKANAIRKKLNKPKANFVLPKYAEDGIRP